MISKRILILALALSISSPAMASHKAERKTKIVVDVAGSIYVRKPTLNVTFEKYKPTVMKADMNWQIYWTLNHSLNIDYTCWNHDPKVDMCSRIKMEVDSLEHSSPKKLELSTANPSITIPTRTRFLNKQWANTAYLDLNGLAGGEVRATGRLILSQKI